MSKRWKKCKVNCTFLELWLRSRWLSQWKCYDQGFRYLYAKRNIKHREYIHVPASFPIIPWPAQLWQHIYQNWTELEKINVASAQEDRQVPTALHSSACGSLASALIAPLKRFLLMSLMASILLELMGPFMSLSLLTSWWHLTLSAAYFFLNFFSSASMTSLSPVLCPTSSWTVFFKLLFLWIPKSSGCPVLSAST